MSRRTEPDLEADALYAQMLKEGIVQPDTPVPVSGS
jgi:hypothetical protein